MSQSPDYKQKLLDVVTDMKMSDEQKCLAMRVAVNMQNVTAINIIKKLSQEERDAISARVKTTKAEKIESVNKMYRDAVSRMLELFHEFTTQHVVDEKNYVV